MKHAKSWNNNEEKIYFKKFGVLSARVCLEKKNVLSIENIEKY